MDDELPNAGPIKAFIYRYAPKPVRNWMADNAAIARITESLKQDLVRTGEWEKPAGERSVPETVWNSSTIYLDDVHKGRNPERAWAAHEKRLGIEPAAASAQGDLWQQALEAGQAARAAAPERAPAPETATERQL